VLSSLLVEVGLALVAVLVDLVTKSILGSRSAVRRSMVSERTLFKNPRSVSLPSANGGVAVLGNLLVDLLGAGGCGTLDGLRDVVGGLLDGLHFDLVVWCCEASYLKLFGSCCG
jgi:hypothetical protein